MTKKLIRKKTVTISTTEEVSVHDESTAIDGKRDITILIWKLIKKYLMGFAGKGDKNNGTSD